VVRALSWVSLGCRLARVRFSILTKEVAFVINPVRIRRVDAFKNRCRQAAASQGWEPQFMGTEAGETSPQLQSHLSRFVAGPGDRLVFAVGGDGTVRACVHALAYSGVPLAIVPRGTANLFAHALGLPSKLGPALAVGFGAYERQVDLAVADGSPFVAMAGIGLDAAVVRSTPRLLKDHLGWVGYGVGAMAHLGHSTKDVTVRLDGGELLVRRAHSVVVGNVGILPGGFALLPGASLDDGLLDVGILTPKGLLGWASVARWVVAGKHHPGRQFEHYTARHVEVSTAAELPRELDGDVIAPGRSLVVNVWHRALLVRAPRPRDQLPRPPD
jgi:diacylglycerol kinase family enzyme